MKLFGLDARLRCNIRVLEEGWRDTFGVVQLGERLSRRRATGLFLDGKLFVELIGRCSLCRG